MGKKDKDTDRKTGRNKDKDKDKNNSERQNDNSLDSLSLVNDSILNTGIVSNTGSTTNIIGAITSDKGESNNPNTNTTNLQNTSSEGTNVASDDITSNIDDEALKAAEVLRSINIIKEELCKLPLDLCERQYFDNRILPLLTTLNFLSTASINLSSSVNVLTTSPIVPRKKGKLKDSINLIYDMNSKCKDIYKELEDRIDIMLNEDC